ncbi:MAG: FAD/NAD(P)-binding protein [Thermoplasmata archaeon]
MENDSPYRPFTATLIDIRLECGGERPIRTFRLEIDDEEAKENFDYKPGQFVMVSVFGEGESPFALSSPPTDEVLEVTVMRVGNVTTSLHSLNVGDKVGIRGPYGNGFPVGEWEGKNLVFIGAGIGIAPLRSVYGYVLSDEHRDKFGDVNLIYGARSINDMAYKDQLEELGGRNDLELWRCIDWNFGEEGIIKECAEEGWEPVDLDYKEETRTCSLDNCYTAFVPELVRIVEPDPENTIALTCGPPIAIKLTLKALMDLGWQPSNVYTTLENRMKCGIGKCGRCNIGNKYVCKDGPVFNYEELMEMKPENEVTEEA